MREAISLSSTAAVTAVAAVHGKYLNDCSKDAVIDGDLDSVFVLPLFVTELGESPSI